LRRRQESPAYYDFIPVDSTFRSIVPEGKFTPRSVIQKIFHFNFKIITFTDIHVGTGEKLITEDIPPKPVLKFIRDGTGAPVIPGSSVKGVVSTNFLLLSGSSIMTSELFGTTMGQPLISKVFFEDMKPIGEPELILRNISRSWPPKRPRQWEITRKQMKVYTSRAQSTDPYGLAECIPHGSTLTSKLSGINLRDFEVGGLLMSFGLYPTNEVVEAGCLRVGYGKPQGFGQVGTIPKESTFSITEYEGLSSETATYSLTSDEARRRMYAFIDEVQKREAKRDPINILMKYFRRF